MTKVRTFSPRHIDFDITNVGRDETFGVWTDRRHQTSTGATLNDAGEIVIDETALEDNVFGALISARR